MCVLGLIWSFYLFKKMFVTVVSVSDMSYEGYVNVCCPCVFTWSYSVRVKQNALVVWIRLIHLANATCPLFSLFSFLDVQYHILASLGHITPNCHSVPQSMTLVLLAPVFLLHLSGFCLQIPLLIIVFLILIWTSFTIWFLSHECH